MDRIAALNEVLTENPKDAFARYGLAMQYSNQGDFDRALAEFSILLENHPDYTAGYFMAAQTLVRAERHEEAKMKLTEGIASARRTGNLHAQSEMEAMLADLTSAYSGTFLLIASPPSAPLPTPPAPETTDRA
jgi:predicted Zn-dependent protease